MIGGEGDGQAAFEDFRMLFAPKSSVLAEMQTMAPEPEERAHKPMLALLHSLKIYRIYI